MEGETCVIAFETEIAAAKPRCCGGDEHLVAGERWTSSLGLSIAAGLGAFEDCERDPFGPHVWCFDTGFSRQKYHELQG